MFAGIQNKPGAAAATTAATRARVCVCTCVMTTAWSKPIDTTDCRHTKSVGARVFPTMPTQQEMEEERILASITEETPALRRYRRLLRRRQYNQRRRQAEDVSRNLRCLTWLLVISATLGLMAPHSLLVEMMLGMTAIPVILALWLIKMTTPNEPPDDDDGGDGQGGEGRPLVIERTRQEVLEALIEIPVDEDMDNVVCDICQEEYKKGDVMAASRNPACTHLYHQHCIVEWLVNHDECPVCRRNYLGRDDKSTVTAESGPSSVDDSETIGDIEMGEIRPLRSTTADTTAESDDGTRGDQDSGSESAETDTALEQTDDTNDPVRSEQET